MNLFLNIIIMNLNFIKFKNILESLTELKLPISNNKCLTILDFIDLKNNRSFQENYYKNLKNKTSDYKVMINDQLFQVCINNQLLIEIDKIIFKYIEMQIEDSFKSLIYGKKLIKKKYIFLGDCDSINIEIICKSYPLLKNKIKYIIIGNIEDLQKYLKKIKTNIKLKEIIDPYDFHDVDVNYLNIYNVNNISIEKFKNLLNQIKIANIISNKTGLDLITMPIDKSLFKKKNEIYWDDRIFSRN